MSAEVSEHDIAQIAEDVRTVHAKLREAVTAEAQRLPVPLTPQQYLAMQIVVGEADHEDGLSLSELTDRMGLAHSTVSGIVTRLQRRGLLQRARATQDRRVNRIHLTEAVQQWVQHDIERLWQQPLTTALQHLDQDRCTALRDGLAALRHALEGQHTVAREDT